MKATHDAARRVSAPKPSVPSPKILTEDPLRIADWDTRVVEGPNQSVFHTAAWAAVLKDTYGFTPVYFTTARGSHFDCILPVMQVDNWGSGRRGVSLPFSDRCDPLGGSELSLRALFQAAVGHGRRCGWRYLECRGGPESMFPGGEPSLCYYGHTLDLTGDPDALFAGFKSSTRRAIRKAQKSGLVVESSRDLGAIKDYYRLHCQTRRQHGLPPQPFQFFLNIHRKILSKNMGMVISARYGNRTVASAIMLTTGRTAVFKFGASDSSHGTLRANNLVMWEAIRSLALAGCRWLDFGRTSLTNEGLRRFKLGWGTREYRLNYYKYDLRQDRFVTERDPASGWHTHVFRAMPIFLGRLLGGILYRHAA